MSPTLLQQIMDDHIFHVRRFFEQSADGLGMVAHRLVRTLREEGRIFLAGNGGSAADAQHIAAELVGRFEVERPGLPAIALTVDTSALTAISNDFGYERVFARQIEALAEKRDALIAISTSGESPNVIEAVRAAKSKGMVTIGLLGRDGGRTKGLVDHALIVDGKKASRIQEVHILIGHVLCELIEREMFRRGDA